MRVLWISECPWIASGFGKVTHYMTKLLRENGFDVVCSCFSTFAVMRYNEIQVYPFANPLHGFIDHIERREGEIDVVVFHGAPWIPPLADILPQVLNIKKRTIGYFVHEWLEAPSNLKAFFKYVHLLAFPSTYLSVPLNAKRYVQVPHGVNPDIFKPIDKQNSKLTIGMIAKNHPRKRWDIFLCCIHPCKEIQQH
jgi:hypothetical protein